jgi:hypothetical protein
VSDVRDLIVEAVKVHLDPDDVLIFRCDQQITCDQASRIKALAQEVFINHRVLVLGPGVDIEIYQDAPQ